MFAGGIPIHYSNDYILMKVPKYMNRREKPDSSVVAQTKRWVISVCVCLLCVLFGSVWILWFKVCVCLHDVGGRNSLNIISLQFHSTRRDKNVWMNNRKYQVDFRSVSDVLHNAMLITKRALFVSVPLFESQRTGIPICQSETWILYRNGWRNNTIRMCGIYYTTAQ